jgi:hypothetical protein
MIAYYRFIAGCGRIAAALYLQPPARKRADASTTKTTCLRAIKPIYFFCGGAPKHR